MRPADDPWREESRHGLLGNFCCDSISSCFYFFCCCWLLQDCLPGFDRPGHYRNRPGPYNPSAGLPFGPSFDHHPRPTDPLVGPGPAPRFGPPGGPPHVPGPLGGPLGQDPAMFEPPGPPRY